MKQLSLFRLLFLAVIAWTNAQMVSSQNYGVKIAKAKADEYKSQLRFDDLLLGEHTNGMPYNSVTDSRLRSFTLSTWFKTDEAYPERYGCQLLGYGYADYYGVLGSFSVNLEWGKFTLGAKAWSTGDTTADLISIKTNLTCKANIWYFLSVVVDDVNKEIRFYIDGELMATANTAKNNSGGAMNGTALLSEKSVFYLNNGTSGGNISTIYDEVQLWNKVLSADEIKVSMKGYLKAPEGLTGYYTFDTQSSVNVYPNEGYGAIGCPATVVSSFVYGFQATSGDYGKTLLTTDARADGCDKINKTVEKFVVNIEKMGEGNVALVDSKNNEYDSGVEFEKEMEISVKAIPVTNYLVDSIKVNGLKLDITNPKFKVQKETTVKVFFGLMKTRIAVDDGTWTEGGKYICLNSSTSKEFDKLTDNIGAYYSIPYGSIVKVNVETKSGYLFSAAEVKDSKNTQVSLVENSFTVASTAYIINLSFDKLYTVKLEREGDGSVVVMDDQNVEFGTGSKFKKETNLRVKAIAAANFQVDSVKVNGMALDLTNLKFKVMDETVVKVYFGLMKTKIAVDNNKLEGGKYVCINPKTNSEFSKKGTDADSYYEITYGVKVKVKAMNNNGFILSKMEVKDAIGQSVSLDSDDTFVVSASRYTVDITFNKVYSVVYTASPGGSLEIREVKDNSIIGNEVVAGTRISMIPTADDGYRLKNLKVNSEVVTLTDGKYSMDVNGNVTVEVTFESTVGITDMESGQHIYYDAVNEIIHTGMPDSTLSVYNFIGKEVVSLSGGEANVSVLPSGVYLLKATSGHRTVVLKFFKK